MGLGNWEAYHYKVSMIEKAFSLVRRVEESCSIASQFSAVEVKEVSWKEYSFIGCQISGLPRPWPKGD